MINRRNYYRILHVQPDAPEAVIKASYRALMQKLKLHPDLGGNSWNAAVLNQAYTTLSDMHKRAAYDRQLESYSKEQNVVDSRQDDDIPAPGLLMNMEDRQCLFCGEYTVVSNDTRGANTCIACDSPLESCTAHLQTANVSGRALQRLPQNAPVRYFTQPDRPAQFGVLLDLSPLGLQFQLSEALQNEQVIKVVCDALTAVAAVRRCNATTENGLYIAGIEFLASRFNERRGTFFSEAVC